MRYTTWGAAEQVSGSMHLLEISDYKILIDCGLDYENKKDIYELNINFPFLPEEIDIVILTHAHLDHSGNIPNLIKQGFKGQVICTPPTAELASLLFSDFVNVAMSKSSGNGNRRRGANSPSRMLYLHKHVNDAIDKFFPLSFGKEFKLNDFISMRFIRMGHLLGAAGVVFTVLDNGITKTIGFTGDLGRYGYPVLQDPEPFPEVEHLICESTYGGRFHQTLDSAEDILAEIIKECCIDESGRMIIPAFSIGRTQSLIFVLNKIFSSGKLPPVRVFVDSPLAIQSTEVYRKFYTYLSEEAQEFYSRSGDQFDFANLQYIQNLKDSKQVANYRESCIIVSSAGMLEGGRIQDHLFNNIQNYYCTILFIGFCAPGTLGHKLLNGASVVKLNGKELAVFATIRKTDILSGHADHTGLISFIKQQSPQRLKNLFLVHGEPESMQKLTENALELGYENIYSPFAGESFDL